MGKKKKENDEGINDISNYSNDMDIIDQIDDTENEIAIISDKKDDKLIDDESEYSERIVDDNNKLLEIVMTYKKIRKIIPEERHTTTDKISLLERTELIGLRATIIDNGSPIFTEALPNTLKIAEREYNERNFPLVLYRLVETNVDHTNKLIVEKFEIKDPNKCIH